MLFYYIVIADLYRTRIFVPVFCYNSRSTQWFYPCIYRWDFSPRPYLYKLALIIQLFSPHRPFHCLHRSVGSCVQWSVMARLTTSKINNLATPIRSLPLLLPGLAKLSLNKQQVPPESQFPL